MSRIKLKGTNKIFHFRNFDISKGVNQWVDLLKLHISQSQGITQPIKDIYMQKRFWRVRINSHDVWYYLIER